jgi:hypothetical protein
MTLAAKIGTIGALDWHVADSLLLSVVGTPPHHGVREDGRFNSARSSSDLMRPPRQINANSIPRPATGSPG